jgi:arylsulfatase A-like enzyme
MQRHGDVTRRRFLEGLGAVAATGGLRPANAKPSSSNWTPPPAVRNPNILIIMVDQMRLPMWMNSSQLNSLPQTILPNIMGRIAPNSYNFGQFFTAATVCTPARATLLTGLYAPQTAMYITAPNAPSLNPAYPTWGQAIAALNPAYQGNVWWFGKWHLSTELNATPLLPYGFRTRNYPGGAPPYNPDPTGSPNEGTDGGPFNGLVYANDAMIAGDFSGWLEGQAPTNGTPSSPWCATVSLVNPHDIAHAPAWFVSNPFPPTKVPLAAEYFPPPSGNPPSFYKRTPSPWNHENLPHVPHKPTLQNQFLTQYLDPQYGKVTDWALFLNQYIWMQQFVDQQVGQVLNTLQTSPFWDNTIIVFLADHGEYAGSHGLHDKGRAAYDESLRVPFYVQFPGQQGSTALNQMCSSVDLFGLICDLATGGSGAWKQAYPDLAQRQSMWSFLNSNASETRVAPAPIGLPYVFHTYDQEVVSASNGGKCHIVCMRTKQDVGAGQIGGKLAFYSAWAPCTTYPNATAPDPEFYDYDPQTTNNASEIGNDYFSTNTTVQNKITEYAEAIGSLTPPSSGLIGSELNPPLMGTGTDGNPLSLAQAAARESYYQYQSGSRCASD